MNFEQLECFSLELVRVDEKFHGIVKEYGCQAKMFEARPLLFHFEIEHNEVHGRRTKTKKKQDRECKLCAGRCVYISRFMFFENVHQYMNNG